MTSNRPGKTGGLCRLVGALVWAGLFPSIGWAHGVPSNPDGRDGRTEQGAPRQIGTTETSTDSIEAERARYSRSVAPDRSPELDLGRLVLQLPAHFVELAFVPLLPIATLFDRYYVVDRFIDLVTNDARTLALLPLVEPFSSSGLGLGATLLYNDPLGSPDRLTVLGLVRTNRDRDISISLSRRLPSLSGRAFRISASYSADHDARFYGFGAHSVKDDERLIRTDAVNAEVELTLFNPSEFPEWEGAVEVAYRRRRLSTGTGPQAPGLTRTDIVRPPPGFGSSLDFPELTIRTTYDSRDSEGRTTRGFFAEAELSLARDLDGAHLDGVRVTGRLGAFVPVLPLFRVLFFSVGAAGSTPVFGGSDLPLHLHTTLGGSNILRGYQPNRFVDRLAWWATAEYRFRFYEYAGSSMQISAALFVDSGQVGDAISDLLKGPFPYSVGLGLRFEQNLLMLGRLQIAYSPEGFRLTVGFGDLL